MNTRSKLTMDPEYSLQDVLRCDLCQTPVPPMYCDICHFHLCKACVGEHLSEFVKEHKIVPFEKRGCTTKCPNHSSKICELYCEQCDIPICVQCIFSTKHQCHTFADIVKILEKQKSVLQKDLQELEKLIFPKYQEIASNIPVQKDTLNTSSQEIASDISKHGEEMHKKIDVIIKNLKSDLDEMGSKYLTVLNKHEDDIKHMLSDITQTITDLRKLINSDDVNLVSAYKSRNAKFKKLPKLTVTLPSFSPQKTDSHQMHEQFGSLSELSIETEEHNFTLGTEHSPAEGTFIDVPQIVTEINTDYKYAATVCCLSDEDIWIRGDSDILRLYNLQRGLLKSVKTKSGKRAEDVAVTRSGDLLYTNYLDRTLNIVKNTNIQTVITLQGWRPSGVCSTSSSDILVVMESDDLKTPSKVVRYSCFIEKQSIQYKENGQALYSSGGSTKYISENRNQDICVSDCGAGEVVVVNQAGKFRFTYTGLTSSAKELFEPYGITTDCHLEKPFGLCVDTRDNLFVADAKTCKVKKIQYYK